MSDTEDIQRELTGESQPDDKERGEVQTTSGESEADYNPESETETVSESNARDTKDIQREQTGEFRADDEERQVLKARNEHPDEVTKQIMEEAKKENVKWGLVKSLIALHPDMNYLNQNGETALRLAWNAENIKLVRLLLDKGAQFDVQNANRETSLQIEHYIEKNHVQKRENVLDLMIEYDQRRYPEALEDSQFRIKNQIKKIVPTSGNLRDCLYTFDPKEVLDMSRHSSNSPCTS